MAADGTHHRPSFSNLLLYSPQNNTEAFTVRVNVGSQGTQWLLAEHGSHSPTRLASTGTMSSAGSHGGEDPEGRGSLSTDSRREALGGILIVINPMCHDLPFVPSS